MTVTLNRKAPVTLYDMHPPLDDLRTEVLQGLSQPEKTLSPKFLYDKAGSELFDAICTLDEYYLTRTEMAILQTYASEIAAFIGDGVLVEFGSGSSQKVKILLDAMPHVETYVALDISKQHLYESCVQLVEGYEGLEAIAICTDYTQPIHLPEVPALKDKRKVGFFPGSSIGNLEPKEVIQFLKNSAMILEPQGDFLIGVDLKKDKAILEPAYDDARGVSAAFALNVLTRINRELNANFNLQNFSYNAFYNPIGRIEMYIVSLIAQEVQIGDVIISFDAGERIRTEHSYKYSIVEFQDLAAMAGFQAKCVWTDPDQLFSLHYLHSVA